MLLKYWIFEYFELTNTWWYDIIKRQKVKYLGILKIK